MVTVEVRLFKQEVESVRSYFFGLVEVPKTDCFRKRYSEDTGPFRLKPKAHTSVTH